MQVSPRPTGSMIAKGQTGRAYKRRDVRVLIRLFLIETAICVGRQEGAKEFPQHLISPHSIDLGGNVNMEKCT